MDGRKRLAAAPLKPSDHAPFNSDSDVSLVAALHEIAARHESGSAAPR